MAACSDDVENDTPAIGTEGRGYINVVINLPTQTGQGTRAASDDGHKNDQFDDGLSGEYEVKNTTLVLFKGTDESNATFAKVIELSDLSWSAAQNGNVTSSASTGAMEVSLSAGNYWGLVILNKNNKITATEDGDLKIGDEAINNASNLTKLISSTKASDFCSSEDGFMMLNAPLAQKSGTTFVSGQAVRTLVPVTVYESKEAANTGANDGQGFFVERVVAKVTVGIASDIQVDGGGNKINVNTDGAFSGDQVKLEGWFLNVTNNSTKFVRDVSPAAETWSGYVSNAGGSTSENRFFSTTELTGTTFPYRIYWGVDGNYDSSSYDENAFTTYSGSGTQLTDVLNTRTGSYHPCYCLENTFNTDNMNQTQTTGVVFKMTYLFDPERGETETFFMLENDKTIYLATTDGGDSDSGDSEDSKTQSLISKINEELGDNSISGLTLSTSNYAGGYYDTIDEIKTLFGLTDDDASTTAQSILDAVGPIKVYKNGACYYYTARIEHFGDYYTPLKNTDGSVPTYTEEAHLGRYGVLRNNWYEIEIAGVSGPGYPEIPTPGGEDPDDKKDYYINVKVNILAWAKRKQEVHL